VIHLGLPSQLPDLLYEVYIIFCVYAKPRFREIHENHVTCISINKTMTAFLCAVDTFVFFELVTPESINSCESLFESGMYTYSGVLSIVMILCNMCLPTCFKVCKFMRQHCNICPSNTKNV